MHRIAGLIADTDRHDRLVVAIHGGLAVVDLNPAVTASEDVAVWVWVGEAIREAEVALDSPS